MKFSEFKICNEILNAIEDKGYEVASEIQEKTINIILEGRDLLGCAKTGTGKTAAFAIPILELLSKDQVKGQPKKIRTLILTPTRELAIQIRDNFREYGNNLDIKCSVVFGGVNQASQARVLKNGVDVLVATPGRLLDLINQKIVKLDNLQQLVLDEADTMLDMGFIHDVKKIISHTPTSRQTLMFSATMPTEMNALVSSFLNNPVKVIINFESNNVEKINQELYFVDKNNKVPLLLEILNKEQIESLIIFTKTKHGANKLVQSLEKSNIKAVAIHGNKSQAARVKALDEFKSRRIKILVATDIAARGIDIENLSHVINYELPNIPETYIHRIGRTGRAGKSGKAISFCNVDEKEYLIDIEKLTKKKMNVIFEHSFPMIINIKTPNKTVQKRFKSNKTTMKKERPMKKYYGKSY